ncbi:hypothetical protein HBH92_079750 [Parastagonospora nodorum]|nr:hypothetical protein HBH92_079750 [Parastagonospora nodorum]KAH4440634.1 hypothetical protein HBH93_081570 [Parastagonospora nodorum]KAH4451962.1 hypothetical protein HBH91_109800 [Parastagonospora nodorum]KAH4508633.1 hypothetical protein HBH89_064840 [Parastagonospora nodorum]KAH4546981.1 hypothetical protein HBH85_067590 [Parastagonospora nodorum]
MISTARISASHYHVTHSPHITFHAPLGDVSVVTSIPQRVTNPLPGSDKLHLQSLFRLADDQRATRRRGFR